jgi:anti-anti-sigma factor
VTEITADVEEARMTLREDDETVPTVAADGLRVDRVAHGPVIVYRVDGEIDALTAPLLDQALADAADVPDAVSHVVLDLSEVPFLSSAGLSILVDHHGRCAANGVGLSVVAKQRAVLRSIQITALDRIIPLYPTVSDALTAAGRPN